jgi:hypothetical protein
MKFTGEIKMVLSPDYEDMTLEDMVELYDGVKSVDGPDWVLEDIQKGISEKMVEVSIN